MAVIIHTQKPELLLAAIKKAIDDGTVKTWSYDLDGEFTHTPAQWHDLAWMHPRVYSEKEELRFGFWEASDGQHPKDLCGVYHGRFIEMLLAHFSDAFSDVTATAKRTEPDSFD